MTTRVEGQSTIKFEFSLPPHLRTLANSVTGQGAAGFTSLAQNNTRQLAKAVWEKTEVTFLGNKKPVVWRNEAPHGTEPILVGSSTLSYSELLSQKDPFFEVKLSAYRNEENEYVEGKTLTLTTQRVSEAIRSFVRAEEAGLWVGGRTRVTKVVCDLTFPEGQEQFTCLDLFQTRVLCEGQTTPATTLFGRALCCRPLRDPLQLEFNRSFLSSSDAADSRPKED